MAGASRHQHHTASRTTASSSHAIELVRLRKLSRRSQDLLRQPHHRQLLQHPTHGLARTTEECTKLEAAEPDTTQYEAKAFAVGLTKPASSICGKPGERDMMLTAFE